MRITFILFFAIFHSSFAEFDPTGSFFLYRLLELAQESSPIVTTGNGQVQGVLLHGREEKKYHAYLGIPYARPPTLGYRFEPPHPFTEKWEGVRLAKKFGPGCPQVDLNILGTMIGNEDCLYLNVFVPQSVSKNDTEKVPVMVFFWSTLYQSGRADVAQAKYIMNENVIFVTFDHRVGPFGFLNTGDEHIRGNMGLKDQLMVLKWVHDNIGSFNGDPKAVTIVGQSSGASSVHFHMLSPQSRGLFRAAISMSGNALMPWAMIGDNQKQANYFMKNVGCAKDTMKESTACLRGLDTKELSRFGSILLDPLYKPLAMFGPTIETVIKDDSFLTVDPLVTLKSGNFSKVPYMIGSCSADGTLKSWRIDASPEVRGNIKKKYHTYIPNWCHYDKDNRDLTSEILRRYFGNVEHPGKDLKNITRFISECQFFHPTHKVATFHSQFAPTYMYYMNYNLTRGAYSLGRSVQPSGGFQEGNQRAMVGGTLGEAVNLILFPYGYDEHTTFGSAHRDDFLLLVNHYTTHNIDNTDKDFKVSKNFVKAFVDFASLKPNDKKTKLNFGDKPWPAIEKDKPFKLMTISDAPAMIDEPFGDMDFWEQADIRNPKNGNDFRK